LVLRLTYLNVYRRVLTTLFRRFYRDTNGDISKSIIIAGMGRSGTTWLANIIASQLPCRIMWEPFNPHTVEASSQFNDFQYLRTTDPAPDLYNFARTVLKGDIRHNWIDREIGRITVDYRIVKEIRANLFLNWLHKRFPSVPLIFIVRHPCAVVLSRMEAIWGADEDLNALISQSALIKDHLSDRLDVIRNARSTESKHAILWAIQHLVPLRQFRREHLDIVFYENLCLRPEEEIPRIFQIIGHEFRTSVYKHVEVPSRTTLRTSAIVTNDDKVTRWKRKLSEKQIDDILSVIRDFDLDYIYGDQAVPHV
jgi:hypothetical protein